MIDAIEQALTALGDRKFKCTENTCQGCHADREEAVDILTRALENYEGDTEDAERYRTLRALHWSNSEMCVVTNPKDSVQLGTLCPSEDQLDTMVDKIRKEKANAL